MTRLRRGCIPIPWRSRMCWPMSMSSCLLILLALCFQHAAADLNNDTSPTYIFRSRPDLHPPIIDLKILRPELVSPGYIFIAPYRNRDPGPYIYDNFGDLVWSGAGVGGPRTAHAPHTCQYKGEDHLCFYEGQQHQGFARGHGTIMDKHYRVVQTVESSGAGASADMHEFRLTPYSNSSTALITVYQPRMIDLTVNPRFRIKKGMGWIVEGIFQEVEIGTGRVIFEWRSLDHVDPSLSYTYPATTDTSGNGESEDTPWDYFHVNSVDKNPSGDYLISARHVAAMYKISGVDGHIIWQLGGANPTFNQTNFNFSSQHHARWLSENATHTTLSFFDNASNTFNVTRNSSRGFIVEIDHVQNTACTIRDWGAPETGMVSGSQGSLQLLPGGNVHIGWGEHAYFSEHTWDGDPVQYGILAQRASNVMIYRSYKFNWTGIPLTKPSLWTYAHPSKADAGMVFYTSWNGATEVKTWNFYASNSSSGPFFLLASRGKRGFETVYNNVDEVFPWAFSEALDVDGNLLERSNIAQTFIPSLSLAPYCDAWKCNKAERIGDFEYDAYVAHEEAEYLADFGMLTSNRGFNTSMYYASLPTGVEPRRKGDVDVRSLLLGMLLSLTLFACAGLAYWLLGFREHAVAASPRPPSAAADPDESTAALLRRATVIAVAAGGRLWSRAAARLTRAAASYTSLEVGDLWAGEGKAKDDDDSLEINGYHEDMKGHGRSSSVG